MLVRPRSLHPDSPTSPTLLLCGVLALGAASAAAETFSNPFEPPPLNAYGFKILNPDTGHEDGPFALPGVPNPLGLPVVDLGTLEGQWAVPDLCDLIHLHGTFAGHPDPAPGPPATESACGHGGLVYLLGPDPISFGPQYCPVAFVDGRLEPTQGVWQDDPVFADAAGKQISRPDPFVPAYVAELPMIRRRDTLLVGIVRPVGGATIADGRNEIFLDGITTGSAAVPAHIRFTLTQGGSTTWTHDSPVVHMLPFGGPCDSLATFRAELDATTGIPAAGGAAGPFTFSSNGPYLLKAELVLQDGTPTGIQATVQGNVVSTRDLSVLFRPAVLSAATDNQTTRDALNSLASIIALFSEDRVPQWFPWEDGQLHTRVDGTYRILFNESYIERQSKDLREPFKTKWKAIIRDGLLSSASTHDLARGAHLAGIDRMIVLMKRPDYNLVAPEGLAQGTVGLATSTKVIYVSEDALDDEKLVAHELMHTIPQSKWPPGPDGNDPACGIVYHNQATGRAHGLKIRDRQRMDGVLPLLGPDASTPAASTWITQCSYWHLLNTLDFVVDPPVLLVSGYVLRDQGATFGGFTPFYEKDGVVDLAPGAGGDWALVLRDGAGAQLERFPFVPNWDVADLDEDVDLVGFAFELPILPGLEEVELVGPSGLLESRLLSATAPSTALGLPASDGGLVPLDLAGRAIVDWSAADADGDALVHSVLYSSDGGQSWVDVAIDRDESTLRVAYDPAGLAHRVRVLSSDGARSTTVEAGFEPATSTVELFGRAEGGTVGLDIEGEMIVVPTTMGESGASVAAKLAAAIDADASLAGAGIVGESHDRLVFTNGVIASVTVSDAGLSVDPEIFADGFESGDTSAWTVAVP